MSRREISLSHLLMLGVVLTACGCGVATKPKPKAKAAVSRTATKSASLIAETVPAESPLEATIPGPAPIIEEAPVFRPDDQRPTFDDAALKALGIARYESKRLRLFTDIPADDAQPLPTVIDAAYDALTAYFGALPPSRAGDEFQLTGYLMQDEKRFREAGMIPDDLPPIEHGRHHRNQFWLREQSYDYYRRHLLIHEATHCVMMFLPENRAPVWYLEGMAEYFGTHHINSDGTLSFRVMPTSPEAFAGFGRITLIRKAVEEGRRRTMSKVFDFTAEEYLDPEPYAWSWAVCHFLDHHPRYSARFRELGQNQQPRAFAATLEQLFADDARDLANEWELFVANLQYGYDVSRAAITFQPGTPWKNNDARTAEIVADRGWQSTRIRVEADQLYEITATGQFTLAQHPKPWISTADGISFRYVQGLAMGKMLACVRAEDSPAAGHDEAMLRTVPVGSRGEFTTPVTGTLYLRLNDSWSELADNTGGVTVKVAPLQK